MTLRRLCILVMLLCPFITRSQDSRWQADLAIGYSYMNLYSSLEGVLALPPNTSGVERSFAPSVRANLAYALYQGRTGRLSLVADVMYVSAAWTATEPTLFNRNGVGVPGAFEHRTSLWWLQSGIGLKTEYDLLPGFHLIVDVLVALPMKSYGTSRELMVAPTPTDIVYAQGGRERMRADGSIAALIPYGMVGMRLLVFEEGVTPYVEVRYAMTSAVQAPGADVRPLSALVGVQFPLFGGSSKSKEESYTTMRPAAQPVPAVPPQPVAVDSASWLMPRPAVQDCGFLGVVQTCTLASATGRNAAVASVQLARKVTIAARTDADARYLKGTTIADSFSSVVVVDSTLVADPPVVRIRVATRAVEGLAHVGVTARIREDTVWRCTTSSYDTTLVLPLGTLPISVLAADTTRIHIQAVAQDSCGQRQMSYPASILLRPERSATEPVRTTVEVHFQEDEATMAPLIAALRPMLSARSRVRVSACSTRMRTLLNNALPGVKIIYMQNSTADTSVTGVVVMFAD